MKWTKREKAAVSLSLTVYAAVLALAGKSPACQLAALAMGAGTLGDALLAGRPPCLSKGGDRLVKGGAAFFFGHLLYLWALYLSCGQDGRALLSGLPLPLALFCVLTVLHGAVFYFRVRSSVPRPFFAAASFYLLTVGVHAAAAAAAAGIWGGAFCLIAAGAVLFYLSDAVLLARKYASVHWKHTEALIWLTYVPAQLCLVTGFFLAGRIPG